jgi:hypothetical protein
MLQTLARLTKNDEDVVLYLREIAERVLEHEQDEKVADGIGKVARLASYFEINPGLFGVSIDIKAILTDIAERRLR